MTYLSKYLNTSNFGVVGLIYIVVSKQAGNQAGFLHFSPRSRDQLKPQGPSVDVPPTTTVTGSLPCIEGCIDKVGRVLPHGTWNRSCIANWGDGQLPKDGFHWENVKHLTVRLALIHDTGTAIQKSLCAKTTKIRITRYI